MQLQESSRNNPYYLTFTKNFYKIGFETFFFYIKWS